MLQDCHLVVDMATCWKIVQRIMMVSYQKLYQKQLIEVNRIKCVIFLMKSLQVFPGNHKGWLRCECWKRETNKKYIYIRKIKTNHINHRFSEKCQPSKWFEICSASAEKVVPLPTLQQVKCLVDLVQGQVVGNKLVQFQSLVHVVVHQFGNILHTLPTCRHRKNISVFQYHHILYHIFNYVTFNYIIT